MTVVMNDRAMTIARVMVIVLSHFLATRVGRAVLRALILLSNITLTNMPEGLVQALGLCTKVQHKWCHLSHCQVTQQNDYGW